MKACPICAEDVQDAAVACRFCGHKFILAAPSLEGNFIKAGMGLAAAVLIFVWLSNAGDSTSSPPIASAAVSPLANDPAKCEALIEYAAGKGIVRRRPSTNRVDVEDLAWKVLPASEKSALLQSLLCAAFGGRSAEQIGTLDYAVAYGYRSGKRVAMIGSTGIVYE